MDSSGTVISVILCTYNRSRLLSDAVSSLASQSLDNSKYEIVIVDNASTDSTSRTLEDLQSRFQQPVIVCVREARQGLDYARNTGLHHARGKYVAYFDD